MTASAIPYFPDDTRARADVRTNDSVFAVRFRQSPVAADVTPADINDETLFLRMRIKDMDSLGTLYERYAQLIFFICARILKDEGEAQDLVHEVFLYLYRQAHLFNPEKGSARSWLLQVTYHRCFDRKKHLKARHGFGQQNTAPGIRSQQQDHTPDFAGQILWNPRMVAAFDQLSQEQQTSLRLYYLNGLTFQEIADQLGCAKGNVKNHVYRGLTRLREIIFPFGSGQGFAADAKRIAPELANLTAAQEESR